MKTDKNKSYARSPTSYRSLCGCALQYAFWHLNDNGFLHRFSVDVDLPESLFLVSGEKISGRRLIFLESGIDTSHDRAKYADGPEKGCLICSIEGDRTLPFIKDEVRIY